MKISAAPDRDVERVEIARQAIGEHAILVVDANGAYGLRQALDFAKCLAALQVGGFKEPIAADDLSGLRAIRKGRRPEWRSRPVNTRSIMCATCCRRKRSTCSRPVSRVVAASLRFCKSRRFAKRFTSICRDIAHGPCIYMRRAQRCAAPAASHAVRRGASAMQCEIRRIPGGLAMPRVRTSGCVRPR